MMHARRFMLAPSLVILAVMSARADDQSATGPSLKATQRRRAIPAPRKWPTNEDRQNASKHDNSISQARAQASGMDLQINPLPGANSNPARPPSSLMNSALVGGQPIAMQAALYGAVTSNPDLVTLREGNALAASAEAVEVARHFPTTLNPTLWIDYRPITLVPNGTFGTGPKSHAGASGNNYYHYGQDYIYVSLRQPVELGHQTRYRYHIAQAAYDQQKWLVVQAELTALVQTYRFFQTAAYRREKFRLAEELADFNDRLQETLQRRMEANQVQPADVSLARVESRSTRQLVKAARQDYLIALTDMRNQIGIPEQAGTFEPLGEFSVPPYIPPVDEQVMVQEALRQPRRYPRGSRPGRRHPVCREPGEGRSNPDPDHRARIPDGRSRRAIHRVCFHRPDSDLEQRQAPGPSAGGRAPTGAGGRQRGPATRGRSGARGRRQVERCNRARERFRGAQQRS